MVQTVGFGYRLPVRILMEKFDRAGPVMRWTQALLTHMAQIPVCHRHHTVEQQLCRWLLLTLDRLMTNERTYGGRVDRRAVQELPQRAEEAITPLRLTSEILDLAVIESGKVTMYDSSMLCPRRPHPRQSSDDQPAIQRYQITAAAAA